MKKDSYELARNEFEKAFCNKKICMLLRENEVVGRIFYRYTGKNVYISVLLNIRGSHRDGYFCKMNRYTSLHDALVSAFTALIPEFNQAGLTICRSGIEANLQDELNRVGISLVYLI